MGADQKALCTADLSDMVAALRASIENARSDMLPIAMQTTRELEGLFHKDSSLFGVCVAD